MMMFFSIALAAFIIVAGSFLFGHDSDGEHDIGHDADGGDAEPTISFFSSKVLGTLLMGFGAAGAIARHYELSYLLSSLIGLGFGIFLSALMYMVLGVFYKQQASSLIPTGSAVGCTGRVTTSISENGHGEVGIQVEGQYCTYLASSADGGSIPKGQPVRVVRTLGSELVVERE